MVVDDGSYTKFSQTRLIAQGERNQFQVDKDQSNLALHFGDFCHQQPSLKGLEYMGTEQNKTDYRHDSMSDMRKTAILKYMTDGREHRLNHII